MFYLTTSLVARFYLWLYGVRHMVKDHSDSERGNPHVSPHGLCLFRCEQQVVAGLYAFMATDSDSMHVVGSSLHVVDTSRGATGWNKPIANVTTKCSSKAMVLSVHTIFADVVTLVKHSEPLDINWDTDEGSCSSTYPGCSGVVPGMWVVRMTVVETHHVMSPNVCCLYTVIECVAG